MPNKRILTGLLSVLIISAATASGQEEFGLTEIPLPFPEIIEDAIPTSEVIPPSVFPDALYSTGGTSLRNESEGGISLSGNGTPLPAAIAAFAYWAVITAGPHSPGLHDRLEIRKLDPKKSKKAKLKGTVVGTGPDPCWPGDTITVFKAAIPLAVVNAGGGHAGFFDVKINCLGASSCLGEDPWGTILPPPLWQGASIVAVWPAPGRTTSIYDLGLSGTTFLGNPGLNYTLLLPLPTFPGQTILWDNIGADGQHGFSRIALTGLSDERTTILGVPVAGPGSAYTDSDWNGNDSNPLPSLWDTTGHESFASVPTVLLPITFSSASGLFPTDCLTPVANVVAQ